MDFDDIEMTQSFKFRDDIQIQPQQQENLSLELQKNKNRYVCYTCGGDETKAENCPTCQGTESVGHKDPLVSMLQSIFFKKIKPQKSQKPKQKEKKTVNAKRLCSEIKEQQYVEETYLCSECLKLNPLEDLKIICDECEGLYACNQCANNMIINHSHSQNMRISISQPKQQENSQILIESTLLNCSERQVLKQSSNSMRRYEDYSLKSSKQKKYLRFSPTKSRGSISPTKSDQSSMIQVICDETDSQPDEKPLNFKILLQSAGQPNMSNVQNIGQSSIQENQKQSQQIFFHNYFCDSCGATPKNFRYSCQLCQDYDLCQQCYANKRQIHEHSNFKQFCKTEINKEKQELRQTVVNKFLSSYGMRSSSQIS